MDKTHEKSPNHRPYTEHKSGGTGIIPHAAASYFSPRQRAYLRGRLLPRCSVPLMAAHFPELRALPNSSLPAPGKPVAHSLAT